MDTEKRNRLASRALALTIDPQAAAAIIAATHAGWYQHYAWCAGDPAPSNESVAALTRFIADAGCVAATAPVAVAAATTETIALRVAAERIVDSAPFAHARYDSCPCCGYDGMWEHDTREDAVEYLLMVMNGGRGIPHKFLVTPEGKMTPAPLPKTGVDSLPVNCRQRLHSERKPYPRSSCGVCGAGAPRHETCLAIIASGEEPKGPTINYAVVQSVAEEFNFDYNQLSAAMRRYFQECDK